MDATPFNDSSDEAPCNSSTNPWCGEFGTRQYIELSYLVVIIVLGIFGNLLVMLSMHFHGKKKENLFIINLAMADFIVS